MNMYVLLIDWYPHTQYTGIQRWLMRYSVRSYIMCPCLQIDPVLLQKTVSYMSLHISQWSRGTGLDLKLLHKNHIIHVWLKFVDSHLCQIYERCVNRVSCFTGCCIM